jgi:hypothetical protein
MAKKKAKKKKRTVTYQKRKEDIPAAYKRSKRNKGRTSIG